MVGRWGQVAAGGAGAAEPLAVPAPPSSRGRPVLSRRDWLSGRSEPGLPQRGPGRRDVGCPPLQLASVPPLTHCTRWAKTPTRRDRGGCTPCLPHGDKISGMCAGAARGERGGVHRAPGPWVSGTSRRGLGCKPASPRRPGLSLLPCTQPTCPDSPHPGWTPNTSRGPRGRGDRSWGRAEKGGRGERGQGCPQSRGVLRRACEGPTEVKVDPRGRPGAVHRAEGRTPAGVLGGRGWAAAPT